MDEQKLRQIIREEIQAILLDESVGDVNRYRDIRYQEVVGDIDC